MRRARDERHLFVLISSDDQAAASHAASDQGRRSARTQNSFPSGSASTTQLSSPWPTSACRAPRSSRRRTSSSCSLSVGLTSRWSLFLTVLLSGTCANVNVGGTGPRWFLPSGTIGEPIVTIPLSSSCTSWSRTEHQNRARPLGSAQSIASSVNLLVMSGPPSQVAAAQGHTLAAVFDGE